MIAVGGQPALKVRLGDEPRGVAYRGLLALGRAHADVILLVVRDEMSLSETARRIMHSLGSHLVGRSEETSWPGTRTLQPHIILRYAFNGEVERILGETADGLYEWVQPERPEDLCFLSEDGSPWLATIAHERMATIYAQANDFDAIKSALPGVALLIP